MNDKNQKQESSTDLKARLLKHLEETGYPLELQVGGILSKHGWRVDHNSYYIDEDEQKGREIDIIAITNTYSQEYKVTVWNNLICEVKKAKKHPWIILSTKRGIIEHEGWGRLHYTEGQVDSTLLPFEQIEMKSTTSQFLRIGRSYCEGFKLADAKSSIFEALTTVVKASEYWLKKNKESSWGFDRDNLGFRDITFVDSIIVLDGLLYEAYLDDDNHLRINKTTHLPVSFGYVSKAYGHEYLVEIITFDAFAKLLSDKRNWIDSIKDSIINKLSGSPR